jgi:hypothetical protein
MRPVDERRAGLNSCRAEMAVGSTQVQLTSTGLHQMRAAATGLVDDRALEVGNALDM